MNICLLGATGSIGLQTLDVVRTSLPDCNVVALTGFNNLAGLTALVKEFEPKYVCVKNDQDRALLKKEISHSCEILTGDKGLEAIVTIDAIDMVINALVGDVGLLPTFVAIHAGKNIALANKETLVTAGEIIMPLAKAKGITITPIDSEHSAIWQCLKGEKIETVEKIILTASGGPFRTWEADRIKSATVADALAHPNWSMGRKISIDSATLMNKGLELIEAMWLFDQPVENIQVLIHPQSIIHSMVQYVDGTIIAQLGTADMRTPIMYALTAPGRAMAGFERLDFLKLGSLTFEAPDIARFPCLDLAMTAAKTGGTLPTVMNTVNEQAVGLFLDEKIGFMEIPGIISRAFDAYAVQSIKSIDDILAAKAWALEFVSLCEKSKG